MRYESSSSTCDQSGGIGASNAIVRRKEGKRRLPEPEEWNGRSCQMPESMRIQAGENRREIHDLQTQADLCVCVCTRIGRGRITLRCLLAACHQITAIDGYTLCLSL